MAKVKLTLGDRIVDAEKVEFKATAEPWSIYHVADGNIAKLKLIVTDIFRLDERDPVTGMPAYIFKSSTVAAIEEMSKAKGDH